MKRIGVVVILLLAFGGMADAAYLAQHELNGTPLICDIQNLSGCNTVASSSYSHLFGIPLAIYGVIFYAVLFVLAAMEIFVFDRLLRRVIQIIAAFGVIAEIGFTLIQIYLINALCAYCLASALIAFLILVFASMIEPIRRDRFDHTRMSPLPPPISRLPMPPV